MLEFIIGGGLVRLYCYEDGKQHCLNISYYNKVYKVVFSGKLNCVRQYKCKGVFLKHFEEWQRIHNYTKTDYDKNKDRW